MAEQTTYTVKLSDGREFDVTTDGGAPTEAAILASLKEPDVKTSNAPLPVPRDARGRPAVSSDLSDSPVPDWKAKLATALETAAHPKEIGDLLPLLVPSGGAAAVGEALAPVGRAVAKYGGAATKLAGSAATALLPPAVVTPARAALKVLGELNPSEWNNPLTVAGREGRSVEASRAFNALPLAEQMKQLPATPPPELRPPQPPPLRLVKPPEEGAVSVAGYPRTGTTSPPAVAPSVAAVLSDVELARKEYAAGRLPKAMLDAVERKAAQAPAPVAQTPPQAAPAPPVAANAAPASPPPAPVAVAPEAPPNAAAVPVSGDVPRAVVPQTSAGIANAIWTAARDAKVTLSPTQNSAAFQVVKAGMSPAEAVASVQAPAAATAKAAMNASEVTLMQKMRATGKTDAEIATTIANNRAFIARFGTPTPTAAETRFTKGMRGKPAGSD